MRRRDPFRSFSCSHCCLSAVPLTESQAQTVAVEIAKCDRLLAKLWADDSREQVLRRRRSLLRLLHDVPLAAQLPINWQPPAHPQVANLPREFH